MNLTVLTKKYSEPAFCEKEILRYAGCREADDEVLKLMYSCIDEVREKLSYKVCFAESAAYFDGDTCKIGTMEIKSQNLAKCLEKSKSVILFAATIGTEIDRQIAKYSRISPSRALMIQAIGAERVEALCDMFCRDISSEKNISLTPRFSPGYGDLSLKVQKEIFAVLNCSKYIGLTLNDSLLMSPSKSVTAFAGISDDATVKENKCLNCNKTDCLFRGAE